MTTDELAQLVKDGFKSAAELFRDVALKGIVLEADMKRLTEKVDRLESRAKVGAEIAQKSIVTRREGGDGYMLVVVMALILSVVFSASTLVWVVLKEDGRHDRPETTKGYQ